MLGPDESLWAETSDEAEARSRARPGDTLQRLWHRESVEWRSEPCAPALDLESLDFLDALEWRTVSEEPGT